MGWVDAHGQDHCPGSELEHSPEDRGGELGGTREPVAAR
jgi:hypothetical protein